MCRIQNTTKKKKKKKEKGLTKLIRSFGNVTDHTGVRQLLFLGYLNTNIGSSRLLLRTRSSRVILISPEILRLLSDGFCTGLFSVYLDLLSSLI